MSHEKHEKHEKHKRVGNSVTNAPWCEDFSSSPSYQVIFTGAPANGTITQSGAWPFCDQNGNPLPSPIQFISNPQIYICPNASGQYQFIPSPCAKATTKTVTIT